MKSRNLLVSILAFVALAVVLTSSASAEFARFDRVIVNGIGAFGQNGIEVASVYAGETVPVRVVVEGVENATDVRITVRLSDGGYSETSRSFDIIPGGLYMELFNVEVPFDIDLHERRILEITVEDETGNEIETEVWF